MPDAWLQDVALVVQQHEERACVPALVALQQRLPAGVPVVTFPSFFLPCLWSFECVDTRNNTPERHPERAEAPHRAWPLRVPQPAHGRAGHEQHHQCSPTAHGLCIG